MAPMCHAAVVPPIEPIAPPPVVGMVGAGQLARMTHQAAIGLGVPLRVMAAAPDDGAARVSPSVALGDPHAGADLARFAAEVDVLTFDHELVDLDALGALEAAGTVARPSARALTYATDKAHQRRRLTAAGIPVPRHALIADGADLERLGAEVGWPLVLKTARGGYDGRGVWLVDDLDAAVAVVDAVRGDQPAAVVLAEAAVAIRHELAVLVATRPDGTSVGYAPVETVQVAGICREILVPAPLPSAVLAEAEAVARRVAAEVRAVGILAVELFWDGTRILVNEVATRPHNSGHWTIEGAVTSQFANHLRAVADLPLGSTAPLTPVAVCANVLGAADGRDPRDHLAGALAVPGASVHLYGKGPRPGRKIGHVTVLGDHLDEVRDRAARAVAALGDPVPGRPT